MQGSQFEGDMVLTSDQKAATMNPSRNGLKNIFKRWDNGIVPYSFDSKLSTDQKNMIMEALKVIESISCIKFIPRIRERDYVRVVVIHHLFPYHNNNLLFKLF